MKAYEPGKTVTSLRLTFAPFTLSVTPLYRTRSEVQVGDIRELPVAAGLDDVEDSHTGLLPSL